MVRRWLIVLIWVQVAAAFGTSAAGASHFKQEENRTARLVEALSSGRMDAYPR